VHAEALQASAAAEVEQLAEAVARGDDVDGVEAEVGAHDCGGLEDLFKGVLGCGPGALGRGGGVLVLRDFDRESDILPERRVSC